MSFGTAVSAGLGTGYDLRNKQDPAGRRWMPLNAQLAVSPDDWLRLSAEADYDIWFKTWRRASGTLGIGNMETGPAVMLHPDYTNNRLQLPLAIRTSGDYRMAEYLFADSFQDSSQYPELFYVDAEAVSPIAPHLKASFAGQYDAQTRKLSCYSVGLTRDLHCWELEGAYHRYVTGEYRFTASIRLKAFPGEQLPLVTF
jgi:hypothetical protein